MSAAVAEPKTRTSSEWRESIARASHILGHLDSWLQKPPEATSLDDLLAVKGQVDPAAATPGALLVRTLAMVPLLFQQMQGGKSSVAQRPKSDDTSPARRFAASVAGEPRREEIEELIGDFLGAIDKEILRQLDEGLDDDRLIRSADFVGLKGNGLVVLDRGDGVLFQAGLLNYLPDGHQLRLYPGEFLYDHNGSPAIVLGPSLPSVFGGPGVSRPFYLATAADRQTRDWRLRQLRGRKESPHLDPAAFKTIFETLRQVEGKMPPRPSAGTPEVPYPMPAAWKDKTLQALDVIQFPRRIFVGPAEGTSISDLLAVRDLLGVREEEPNQNVWAAKRFAARVVGETRKDELVDLLHPLLNAIDRVAVLEIDRALLWACRESARPAKGRK